MVASISASARRALSGADLCLTFPVRGSLRDPRGLSMFGLVSCVIYLAASRVEGAGFGAGVDVVVGGYNARAGVVVGVVDTFTLCRLLFHTILTCFLQFRGSGPRSVTQT